ncbi:hypothetical protein VaNZ11_002959 [Volvox africanus]|uniref:C2 domain-containing protein n=1 Tax=Volvox africanus TaxID=51714 RepID=A0ABQ5RT35_9CHLO|nr:hypothetical protein VaNZ11_002959 [Volvox africanus]
MSALSQLSMIAVGAAGGPITMGLAAAGFAAAGFFAGFWSASTRQQGLGKAARFAHPREVVEETEPGEASQSSRTGINESPELLLEFLSDSPVVPAQVPTILMTDAKRGEGRSRYQRSAGIYREEKDLLPPGEFDIDKADYLLDLAQHAYKNPPPGQGYTTPGLEGPPAVTFFDKSILTAIYDGVLEVKVERATGLRPLRGKGDVSAYAEVTRGSSSFRTKAVRNTASPVWNATFTFFVGNTNWDSHVIKVFDNNNGNTELGTAGLGMGDLMAHPGRETKLWLPLTGFHGEAGTIYMTCRYTSFQETDPDDIPELKPITEKVASGNFSDMKPIGGLKPAAFVECKFTDTQVWLHSDVAQRKLVFSFRGTEDIRCIKDIWTDVSFVPCKFVPVIEDVPAGDPQISVHSGFMRAYRSVHMQLGALVRAITSSEPWDVEVTGHSLGGALANLAAYELAVYRTSAGHVKSVKLYTYGCPRVGNDRFAQGFNKVLRDAWRITNRLDLVPSLPPSGIFIKYTHAGNPVRLRPDGCFYKGVENLKKDIERDINWFGSIISTKGFKQHYGQFYKDMLTNAKNLLGTKASTSASTTEIPAKAADQAAKTIGSIL